jgi:hypothetical protein
MKAYFCHLLNTRVVPRLLLFSLMASILVLIAVATIAQTVPSWVGHLLLGKSTMTANPTLTAPEAQGLGQKFELVFSMVNDQDPQNSDNDVISLTTGSVGSNVIGVAVRNMLPRARIESLTNQISIKYYFVSTRTCNGGSPRIQLLINPGDGTPSMNAFGYVSTAPGGGGGCVSDKWQFQDMANLADPVPEWDLTQFGGPYANTWAQVVTFFDTTYPNHQVLSGGVFDDSCSFDALACGKAYYDLLTVENRTLENKEDTVQGPTH